MSRLAWTNLTAPQRPITMPPILHPGELAPEPHGAGVDPGHARGVAVEVGVFQFLSLYRSPALVLKVAPTIRQCMQFSAGVARWLSSAVHRNATFPTFGPFQPPSAFLDFRPGGEYRSQCRREARLMKTRVWQFALGLLLGSVPLAAQTAPTPALPTGRPTDQPPPELVAKLKTGPPLPY